MSQVNKYNAPLTGESAVRVSACGFHSVNPCLMAPLNKNRNLEAAENSFYRHFLLEYIAVTQRG